MRRSPRNLNRHVEWIVGIFGSFWNVVWISGRRRTVYIHPDKTASRPPCSGWLGLKNGNNGNPSPLEIVYA
eukprot:m.327535 g.327535  ORF g.327535 m.327535 type:complete len:71 (+) comp16492_c0_seq8:743-955(+)